jgi:hypothetical protein
MHDYNIGNIHLSTSLTQCVSINKRDSHRTKCFIVIIDGSRKKISIFLGPLYKFRFFIRKPWTSIVWTRRVDESDDGCRSEAIRLVGCNGASLLQFLYKTGLTLLKYVRATHVPPTDGFLGISVFLIETVS